MLSTSAMTLKMSIELESEAEYQYEWEGMDAYDEMLAGYAYDNDVFEWSFERVEATVWYAWLSTRPGAFRISTRFFAMVVSGMR